MKSQFTCDTVPMGLNSATSGSTWSSIERDLVSFFNLPNRPFFFFFSVPGNTSLCTDPPDKRLEQIIVKNVKILKKA